jgi:NAD(P)H-hydrate epimerase
LITFKDVAVLDRNSEYFGTETIHLMENAGRAVCQVIKDEFSLKGKTVLFFCGLGNNGGDGFVAARYLGNIFPDCNIKLILLDEPENIRTMISLRNYMRLDDNVPRLVIQKDLSNIKEVAIAVKESNIIVDAVLGAGIRGKLGEPYRAIVKLINASKKPVVSVDVPTGLGTGMQVKPKFTVTFIDEKEEMKGKDCGKVIVKNIGVPDMAMECTGPGYLHYYNFPEDEAHKGSRGKVLVVGGGPFTGAPFLTGMAALRAGVDLVYVLTPEKSAPPIAAYSPNLIVKTLDPKGGGQHITPRHTGRIFTEVSKVDTVVFGPGMGDHPESLDAVSRLLPKMTNNVVIDADGLKAITKNAKLPKKCILTPHRGELERLREASGVRKAKSARVTANIATHFNTTVISKGPIDIIASPTDILLNRTGNPAMATGGTGDVLAGLAAGLLTNIGDPFKAACLGAFLTGYFGDKAYEKKGASLTASDVLDEIAITTDLIRKIPSIDVTG